MRSFLLFFLILFFGCSPKPEILDPVEISSFNIEKDAGTWDSVSIQLMNAINAERMKQGLLILAFSSPLVCAADSHVKDIGPKKMCSHVGSDGSSFITRIKRCGVSSYIRAGEIVACGQKTPADAVKAWMNSYSHRNIILTRSYTNLGCAYYAANKYYVCVFTQI